MTDTTQAPAKAAPAPMPTGGTVMAIVPQTFEEIQRISNQVLAAGIAPSSLLQRVKDDAEPDEVRAAQLRNIAAVSTCIMAGAELGLPPMVSLRAFTVINGKPALYADGNVAVVRKAKTPEGQRVAEYIRTGYTEVRDYICPVCKATFPDGDEAVTHFILDHGEAHDKLIKAGMNVSARTFTRTLPTDKSHAWCEGKRADSGEIYREQFSIEDAKRAGLWEGDKPFRRARVWRNGKLDWHDDAPNDAPWFRYWKRMMMWRAVGYCLRWLFADILGGMSDEYEARDIEGMIDITPQPPTPPTRPQPPMPPADDGPTIDTTVSQETAHDPAEQNQDIAGKVEESVTIDGEIVQPKTEFVPTGSIGPIEQSLLEQLEGELILAGDEPTLEEAFDAFDVQEKFAGNDMAIARAFEIKHEATGKLAERQQAALEAAGQGTLFSGAGGPPMPPEEN